MLTAAARAFEGEASFAAAFVGVMDLGQQDLSLGIRWRTEEVIYERYPACNIAQAPIALAVEFAAGRDLEPGSIRAAGLT